MFRLAAASKTLFLYSSNGRRSWRTVILLFISICISGREMSFLIAAFNVLMAFSTMLRNGEYSGSIFIARFFRPDFWPQNELVHRHKQKPSCYPPHFEHIDQEMPETVLCLFPQSALSDVQGIRL